MPDTTPTPPPFRYVDEDDFHLSAHLVFNLPGTLSITIEGSDEPQSAHVPVADLPKVLAGIAAAAGLPARQVLGTTDQQPETAPADHVSELADWLWTNCADDESSGLLADDPRKIAEVALRWPGNQGAEAVRLAVSEALGLGTGAPWDAIYARAAELHSAPAPVDRAAVLRERADFLDGCLRDAADPSSDPRYWSAISDVIRGLRQVADEAQQPEVVAESCGRFVPDTPRAPGLCASCGDARGWHSREAVEEQPAAVAQTKES